MWIDLNGVWVNTELVAVVRESPLDEDQTVLFTPGQSSVDGGHLIDMPVDDVVEQLRSIAMRELALQLADELENDNKEFDENNKQYPPTIPEQAEFERG